MSCRGAGFQKGQGISGVGGGAVSSGGGGGAPGRVWWRVQPVGQIAQGEGMWVGSLEWGVTVY